MDILIFVAVMVGLFLLAMVAQRLLPEKRKISAARRVSIVGVCAAIAAVLMLFEFPLPFLAPTFYELDLSELPVLLCGFYLGPAAAVLCEILKIVLKLLFKGTSTMFVGEFANFAVGCSMVLPAVIIYHMKKTRKSAFWGLVCGTFVLTAFGSTFNALYLLPTFAKLLVPMENILAAGQAVNGKVNSVWTLVLYCVVPLNLVKGVVVSALTLLLYKRVARPLFGK